MMFVTGLKQTNRDRSRRFLPQKIHILKLAITSKQQLLSTKFSLTRYLFLNIIASNLLHTPEFFVFVCRVYTGIFTEFIKFL